jgi:hypothetical protein
LIPSSKLLASKPRDCTLKREQNSCYEHDNGLNCLTRKVVIVDTPRGKYFVQRRREHLGFWIDEAPKTVVLADGTPLTVHRFDDHWISAARGDTSYELGRQNGNLAYASSTTKERCDNHNWLRPVRNCSRFCRQ